MVYSRLLGYALWPELNCGATDGRSHSRLLEYALWPELALHQREDIRDSTFTIQSYSTYSDPDFLRTDFGGLPGNVTRFSTETVIALDTFGGGSFYIKKYCKSSGIQYE